MKIEEAIKHVKGFLVVSYGKLTKEEETQSEAIFKVVEASEKQIAKKPTSEIEWDKFRDCQQTIRCGACSYEVGRWSKYCPECGQKVERSEEA